MITVDNRTMDEWANVIAELETLDSQPGNLTRKQEQRHATLLAKSAGLRQGMRLEELRHWEQDRLLAEAGMLRAPATGRTGWLDEESNAEWHKFTSGQEVRNTYLPPDSEVRYTGQQAGQQSITAPQGSKGSYFVAPGMSDRLYNNIKKGDDIFKPEFCNQIDTDTGAVMPFPVWSDLGNDAVLVGESVQSTEVLVAPIASTQLGAWSYRSQTVAVTLELGQDSGWPIGAVLEKIFAKRIARGVGKAMILGTGVNQPTGLLTGAIAAGASITIAAGSSTNDGSAAQGSNSIGTNDLQKLFYSLNAEYRDSTASFYMADSTLSALSQLLDKQGRPIISFEHGLTGDGGCCPYLLGRRVAICRSMPSIGAAANSVVFANPDYIIQRRVPSSVFLRRYQQAANLVEAGLIGFEMWCRFDSNLVSSDSNFVPAAILQNHS
jgi:HK97 family phage major capsid protein